MTAPVRQDFSKVGFAKTFVLPALLIFVVPILSYLFFWHAQERFDSRIRTSILQDIRKDAQLSQDEHDAAVRFFTDTPFSQLVTNEQFAANVDSTTQTYYMSFRWMMRLALLSVLCGLVVFLLAGVCALVSLRSQSAQYWSLMIGWHVLRIYGALQAIVLGILIVALSFWVTALWFEFYSIKLIGIAGVLAVVSVAALIAAIFQTPDNDFQVEGVVLKPADAPGLWQELSAICGKVGAEPPDQIIAGIDDSFFVTEHPIKVAGDIYRGRTLFVSLALLKHLNSTEADAVLAHEMAHFSGQDTLYSKKISPMVQRYDAYVGALYSNPITLPIYYFMHCFRAIFEASLRKRSRQREFRADEIAAANTSPRDFAGALLRTVAYSKFRGQVENDLFKQEQALETADVSQRIDRGFSAYAVAFAAEPEIGRIEAAHPFDTHPPLSQRLGAIGIQMNQVEVEGLLSSVGDGGWRNHIPRADELERQQWTAFEDRFRAYHEETLPYRFLPETPEEQAVVEKVFPPMEFTSSEGTFSIDFEKCHLATWPDAVHYREIRKCEVDENQLFKVAYEREGAQTRKIKLKIFSPHQQDVLNKFQQYYGRYLAAVEYQTFKQRADA